MLKRFIHAVVVFGGAGVALAAPVTTSVQSPISYGLTPGRIAAVIGVVIGLVAVVAGGLAMRRAARGGAIAALVTGPVGLVTGGVIVATAEGGLGTGHGFGGGVVAIAMGIVGTGLGARALAHSRRMRPA